MNAIEPWLLSAGIFFGILSVIAYFWWGILKTLKESDNDERD